MDKILTTFIISLFAISYTEVYCQETLWKLASHHEKAGNYYEAIRLKKIMANEDKGTEWFLEDIAGIARCYSYTNDTDSTLYYGQLTIQLAEKLINVSDSIAEEYIQSSAWTFYNCNQYNQAYIAAKKVLALREVMHGKGSPQYLEWLGIMAYQAFMAKDFDGMTKLCQYDTEIAEHIHGINSEYYKEAISSIRAFAHQLMDDYPQFTTEWIKPYYQKISSLNILPKYQYEFEILQLAGFITLRDLKSADGYAQKLKRWIFSSDIPLNDKVRIYLKLANYNHQIGDDISARINIKQGWALLEKNNQQADMAQLIDRHIIELQLRIDTLGRQVMNTEWLIKTATPIIESNNEDLETLAFFYTSLAWAYGYLKDYAKAIYNIKRAIELDPQVARRKKLAQFYVSAKEYKLAEQEYLTLYSEKHILEPLRRSIVSELVSLYWLMKDKAKLASFLTSDFENMKSEVRNAFAFLNDSEREKFLENSLMGSTIKYDIYTSFSNENEQWKQGNELAYNSALIQKGLLLSTTKDIEEILRNAPDSIKKIVNDYEQFRVSFESSVFSEEWFIREKRIALMRYVTEQPQFLKQLNYTWKDIQNRLDHNEAAIEFINLWGHTPDNINNATSSFGALILRKDSDYPFFVKLAHNFAITDLYEFDEEGERLSDLLYVGPIQNKLYQLIWKPLLPYLSGVQTIYYAPTEILQDINFDWIGSDESNVLSGKYNLYRLSSTRELCNQNPKQYFNEAILYGDIAYSINSLPLPTLVKSKYRSTTRAGFEPLKATAIELDSITSKLNRCQIQSQNYRKENATEGIFREMSGKSPKIIHIATHGFYYSRDAIEAEYQYGNFMAFQGMNPGELYHSGLAFSGAQDTWYNETGDISKYINMDSGNDGILLSAEISKLDLTDTDLVVLSACETALGNVTSEGVYGLQRAFKLAGVNSIIMSLWKVDDDATQRLMTVFYTNYLSGKSKRESLLTAQKVVRETPGFEDPYYWAAFILLDGLN